jgi:TusE/DsrC/DsvC family sulfur relay protein
MPTIEVEGKKIEVDEEGYLVHYGDWNEKVACVLAERELVGRTCPMTKEKLAIIKFMRGYYKEFEAFPVPRGVCVNIHQQKDCTYEEFPDPSIAWKIAGLPQPSRHVVAQLKGLGGVS